MKLVKMTEDEFKLWEVQSRANYADGKVRANGFTPDEAKTIAEQDFARLLPQGIDTADALLFSMKDGSETVGFLWIGVRGTAQNRKVFIFDIVVEERHRGRGYGRQAMLLVEEETRKLGLTEIGLHVFAFNSPAVSLYQSLGYETTDLSMVKRL